MFLFYRDKHLVPYSHLDVETFSELLQRSKAGCFFFFNVYLDVHLQLTSINTPHAHSMLLGGHLYFCALFISLARNPVIK